VYGDIPTGTQEAIEDRGFLKEGEMAPEDTKSKTGKTGKTALILSAGAPHSPLIAGALCALWDTGKTFDVIYTSGAGALLGLLYGAPKGKKPREALESLVDLGVSDPIYRLLPIGYKTFFKPGPFTQPIRQLAQFFKIGGRPLPYLERPVTGLGHVYNEWLRWWDTAEGGELKRFYNDLVDLWAAAITPTPLNYWSKGVCDPLPFLEDLVDFGEVSKMPFHFYMNAFSVTERHQTLYANKGPAAPRAFRSQDYRTRDIQLAAPNPKTKKGRHAVGGGTEENDATKSDSAKSGMKMHLFYNRRKDEGIRPQDVRAAFAYPFIYPPVTIDGEVYFEGAGRDPISFGNLLVDPDEGLVRKDVPDIERVVLIDILGALDRYLLRQPRDLLDAFSLSIVVPAVAHARKEIARFWTALEEANEELRTHDVALEERRLAAQARQKRQVKSEGELQNERRAQREEALKGLEAPDQALARITDFIPMSFDIDETVGPHITDWSYSNMSRLFEIGLRDGKKFWEKNMAALDLRADPRQEGYRPK